MGHRNRSKANRRVDSNPKPSEIIAARDRAKHSQTEAAERIHTTLRTWAAWEDANDKRQMHPGLFALYLLKTNELASWNPPATAPKAADVKAAREHAGHTQEEAAKVIYGTKRTWEAWESPTEERFMHPGLWQLYLYKTGQMDRLPQKSGNS